MLRFFSLLFSLFILAGCDQLTSSTASVTGSSSGGNEPLDTGAGEGALPGRPITIVGGTASAPRL